MTSLIQRLSISAHPRLEKSLGYRGDSRWVAWHWEPEIDQLTYADGKKVGAGKSMPWLVFLQHELVHPVVQDYQLAESDRYWLLLDRQTRNLYVSEAKVIQNLFDQPESLNLLACLDRSTPPIQEALPVNHHTLGPHTGLSTFQYLARVIPVAVAAALITGLALGTRTWVVPTVEQRLAENQTSESPISPDANCGLGSSGEFSSYVSASSDRQELHLIGVYEGHLENPVGNHPKGTIQVNVERQKRPMILVLSSYEPVNWNLNVKSGAVIKKIIVNGYHDQTISGVSGIPVEEYSYEGTGKHLGNFLYKWGTPPDSPSTPSLVSVLEQANGRKVTSFQGCYQGSSFSIK